LIVIEESDGPLLLVRQPDHAAACARIAMAWRRPQMISAEMWSRLIAGVRRHDDGWITAEQQPMLDKAGHPFDFKSIPMAMHVVVWRRSIDHIANDPYAALLIAQHARWLYTHFSSANVIEQQRIAQVFCDELTGRIDGYLDQLTSGSPRERTAVEPHALEAARALLSFFDALSLVLIGSLPHFTESEVLAFADATTSLTIEVCKDSVRIHPWPFEANTWRLKTTATRLPHCTFEDSKDLARHMALHAPIQLEWTLQPP